MRARRRAGLGALWKALSQRLIGFASIGLTCGIIALLGILGSGLPDVLASSGLGSPDVQVWLITPLFAVLVAILGLRTDGLLASRHLVRAGLASYSLYMTHTTVIWVITAVAFGANPWAFDAREAPLLLRAGLVAAIVFCCFAVAHACWRLYEEPARRLMRRALPSRPNETPVEERESQHAPGRDAGD